MKRTLGAVSLLVRDYEEALSFYVDKLGFHVIENTDMGAGKRWIRIAPRNSDGTCLLLAKAASPEQESRIGNQTGGRVFFFLYTDDFWRDHDLMKTNGIRFLEEPRRESYATVAVFEDLYGNKWDLLQPNA